MKPGAKIRRRRGCTLRLAQLGVLVFALILFRYEILQILNLLRAAWDVSRQVPPTSLPPAEELLRAALYIVFNVASYLLLGFMLVYLLGSNLLPTGSSGERWEAMRRFYAFFLGERRLVVRIREGEMVRDLPPGAGLTGGIAIVDSNSAIVLERTSMTAGGKYPMMRLGGPGVVFVGRGERLRGVVSLRKQARTNVDVLAQTVEGIEVKTNVTAVFTLGQWPAVIKVAYAGDQQPYNLRVLQIDPVTKKITAIGDDLDEQDKEEIHHYAQNFLTFSEQPAPLEPDDRSSEHPPYPLIEENIFAAVYATSHNPTQDKQDQWTDLPALVATEVFRNMLAQQCYDALYMADDSDLDSLGHKPPGRFHLNADLKPEFARRLRHLGVLSYQLIHSNEGKQPSVGMRVDGRSFRITPVQTLTNSKVLRDRGIKVVAASFGELTPTDPKIYEQRIDNWRARWQQQADLIRASNDREAARIKNQARIDAQREMMAKLTDIFQNGTYTEEALTLEIFQTLEEIASQPGTRQILESETLRMLTGLLLSEGQPPPTDRSNERPALGSGSSPPAEDKG